MRALPRWRVLWIIALFVWSYTLCHIRLFNLLAFEFALACTIPVSFLGAHCAWVTSRHMHRGGERGDELESHAWRPWLAWWDATWSALRLAWVPLIPITLNALWVRNCNWLDGLMFYALLPLVTCAVSSGWGLLISRVMRRPHEPQGSPELDAVASSAVDSSAVDSSAVDSSAVDSSAVDSSAVESNVTGVSFKRELIAFTALFVGVALWGLCAFFFTPSVDVFSTFIGYYPGALYDEEMMIGGRLALSRIEDLVWVGALLSLSEAHRALDGSRSRAPAIGAILSVTLLAWGADLHRPAWWVQRQLGGRAQSEHYHMYHPRSWSPRYAALLLEELEFNHRELSTFFKRAPQRPIEVYFYHNARHKKRLMGAGHTLIAKPWLYTVHLHAPSVGDRVLTHELAHVFSAEIAPAPHHLSLWRGLLPNMVLIEGLAVAAAWTRGRGEGLMGRLTPHQWTAALRRLDRAPPMREIFNPSRFYAYSARLAYTACGSFVRHYREAQGVDELNELYASGGEREGLQESIGAWEAWLDKMELSDQLIQTASSMMSGPSIFYKVCARELAARRSEAVNATTEGDLERALELWRDVDRDAPGDLQSARARVSLLVSLKRLSEAYELINAYDLDDPKPEGVSDHTLAAESSDTQSSTLRTLDHVTRLRFREWRADLEHRLGVASREQTLKLYRDQLSTGLSRPRWRRLAIKRYALSSETPTELSVFLSQAFWERQTHDDRMSSLNTLLDRWPDVAELHYLKAYALLNAGEPNEAMSLFKSALELKLSHPALTYEASRLYARLLFREGSYAESQRAYQALARRVDLEIEEGERTTLELWSRRAAHFAAHRDRIPPLKELKRVEGDAEVIKAR